MRRVIFLVAVLSISFFTTAAQENFYSKHWQRVYKYEQKALPKSARVIVDTLYARAKADGNTQEITKALLYQSKFAMILKENAELEVVSRWKKEISTARAPLRNILESMLASIYWNYFQDNRHVYYQRSTVSGAPLSDDFRTWDANAILAQIDIHFQHSLRNASELQRVKLTGVSQLLIEAEYSQLYRPYLYDLLVHNAIRFYSSDEAEYGSRVKQFPFSARDYESFDGIKISDSTNRIYHATTLYREALAFHKSRNDTAVLVDLEINRLKWLSEASSLINKNSLYVNALRNLKQRYDRHASSALIDFELARQLYTEGISSASGKTVNPQNQGTRQEAAALCQQVIARFPNSHGALQCKSLLENILAQSVRLRTETFLPLQARARILVEYTNLDSVMFTILRTPAELENRFRRMKDSLKLTTLETLKVEASWTSKLKNPDDYQMHTTEVVVPPLPSGRYIIVAKVHNPTRSLFERTFAFAFIQVTDLVLLDGDFRNMNRFQVVNRKTGQPVAGATVEFNQASLKDSINRYTTNKDGFITLLPPVKDRYSLEASVQHEGDRATFGNYYLSRDYARDEEYSEAKTFLFTDRSIYRPGQTVFFKGILIKTKNKKSAIVKGEYVEVFLDDVNGDEVGKLRLKSNSFGSFSGEFKLPATGLTGAYTLYADKDKDKDKDKEDSEFYEDVDRFDYQETEISVEEYKRPTFEVTFKPVTKTFSIGDTILLKGSAAAFNGATLSNARIHYTITRTTTPDWRYRRYGYSEVTLVSVDTVTGTDGSFSIPVIALADENFQKEHLPVFTYEVEVSVTDISGETRTAQSRVHVGYHTLSVALDIPKTLDRTIPKHVLTISTRNLNAQPVPAKGTVRIYKLSAARIPQRPRPWSAPDLPMLTEDEFSKLFPNDSYHERAEDEEDATQQNLVFEIPFNTAQSSSLSLTLTPKWVLGSYSVEIIALDSAGYEIKNRYPVKVIDPGSREVPESQVLFLQTDKEQYRIGDQVKLTLGSASSDITIVLDIECESGFVKSSVEHFSKSSRTITFPVTESMKAGFSILVSAVNYNHFFYKEKHLSVVRTRNMLTFETLTFKDKLQPNAPYTWSFEVKGIPANKDAEVLASMYDASLDQFKSHMWYFNPHNDNEFRSYRGVKGNKSFGVEAFTVRNRPTVPSVITRKYYDQFDWFGFGVTRAKYLQDLYVSRLYSTKSTPEKPSRVVMSADRAIKEGFVYGTVVDAERKPLSGVSVTVVGTTYGAITDQFGNYMLEVDKGEVLSFSFIGMNTVEAKVGRRNTIDVFMEEDITQLSEIVVTAGGLTVQRRELGNQATTVKAQSIDVPYHFEEYNSQNVMGSLAGRVPGLLVTSSVEGLNKNYRIVLRGQQSVTVNDEQLYIVDGVIASGMKVSADDIANIEVLSGTAASALYGSVGKNGALIVTTISGQRKLDATIAKVNVRKNFNETAFFFPHLITNEMGRVRFTFTTPESLTRWKMQLLAHTDDLRSGESTLQAVTQKEFMISPNVPRFLREEDEVTISAKITNLSNQKKEGSAILQLVNAITGQPVDKNFGNIITNVRFNVAARQNTEVSWKLRVPAGIDAVQYKVIAKAGNFGDGEQNIIPVLSNRMVVTETLPMLVRGGQSKTFSLDKLTAPVMSPTIKHQSLTLEITSNPAWYAIRSLPYLIEYPHECAEQLFSRYYANALASHIVNSSSKIKKVLEQWASSGALISNLEKNPELKTILIEETPWVRDAQNEAEQQKRIALLFDLHAMNAQLSAVITKLSDLQGADGGFPWFAGGHTDPYITRHIVAGFGHLRKLGVTEDSKMFQMLKRSIVYLDNIFVSEYSRAEAYANKINGINRHLDNNIVHYLYMRSFFPEIPLSPETQVATDYYIRQQGVRHWSSLSLYTKGMMALVQFRNNNPTVAKDILNSLRENSITSEELGMYWKENTPGWYWYQSPVETQALMIEAFAEIESIDKSISSEARQTTVDELRIWLLRNKQTTQWKTTRATTEAIYALLLQGTEWLAIDQHVNIQIGNKKLEPDTSKVETRTGYFKTVWNAEAVTPPMGEVKINNTGNTITWGGLYWQYSEQLDKITSAETALKLSKKVFKVIRNNTGESITEVHERTPLQPGDLLRIRIELRTDRDLEFIHMKDMRAAGLEPVDVLSQYKWQERLGYYQSTKDASTNFFFDRILKGIYVFEYDLRVNSRGNFSNGITTIQCMYAPEFSSHSDGIRLSIK
jgi:uncharacterized protein YfaS (alpha-2-macroglobulin family)